jgi:predicted AlkP superfamily pyrophosphatase or phosphodiesterase
MNKLEIKSILIFFVLLAQSLCSQNRTKPKLVVGIVIDQMRYEYLYRFQENYTDKGFRKLINNGYNVKNVHYNYIPTSTAPGHASIFTGITPKNHGIIANGWYSRKKKKIINCIEDETVFLVDNNRESSLKGSNRSPRNLMTTTITDELKLFSNGRSKVISISLKDRGAILPAGHIPDGAYWYNSSNGNFITSTYYKKELPLWLKKFNNLKIADSLLNLKWTTKLPISEYVNSNPDNSEFEKIFIGRKKSTFPYNLKELRKKNNNFNLLKEVPYGNTLLTKLFKAAIKGEKLGKDNSTDFLTISYSSTDYIGHNFGIRSKEIEDTYVRMDIEISEVIKFLNKEIGEKNYVLFLTSDHGSSDNPKFLNSKKLPGSFFNPKKLKAEINKYLSNIFGNNNYVVYADKTQIYIEEGLDKREDILRKSVLFLRKVKGIKEIFIPSLYPSINSTLFSNSYFSGISGDILYKMNPGWMENRKYGTMHASPYNNDSHVPLLWYGKNIIKGETNNPTRITQIAPTISFLLNIPLANTSDREPIKGMF